MKFKKFISILLAAALTASLCTVSFATEQGANSLLPTPEQIASMDKIPPIFIEGITEKEADVLLEPLKSYSLADKILVMAQVAEYCDVNNQNSEMLMGFLPYIGEDLRSGLTQDMAAEIIANDEYGDTFKIYAMDAASSQSFNKNTFKFESALLKIASDTDETGNFRVCASMYLNGTDDETVVVLEELYNGSSEMGDKMLVLKHIERLDEPMARVMAKEILDDYTSYEARHVTMANKAFVRSINGEENLIDEAIAINRAFIETGDTDLINGCLYTLTELQSPKAVQTVYDLIDFEAQRGMYTFVDRRFEDVVAYLEEQPFVEFSKTVRAVPLEEFTPVINAKLAQRSGSEEETAELNELLAVVKAANAPIQARANPQGVMDYVGFRDGVAVVEWHAGIIWVTENDGSIKNFIHIAGSGQEVEIGYYDEFMDYPNNPQNRYRGTFRKTTSETILRKIDATAETLLDEAIGYDMFTKIKYNSAGIDLLIEPEDVRTLRCDGVTEYVYSYSGANIQSPYMHYVSGAQTHNSDVFGEYTPMQQSGAMTKVS